MSYDVSFKVKVEGVDKYVPVGDCNANITWNVGKIIRLSTGLPWINEANNGLCKDVIPRICDGLEELKLRPWKYKPHEAANGWGTVEGTIRFFEEIIDAWKSFVLLNDDAFVNVVTFWIG